MPVFINYIVMSPATMIKLRLNIHSAIVGVSCGTLFLLGFLINILNMYTRGPGITVL
jgi:hypothetical protein